MPKITHHSVDSDLKEYVKIKPDLDSVRSQLTESVSQIGDSSGLPTWLVDSLYNVSKKHDDYLRQFGINVKQPPYNAVGDGVTDDTLAIQNALNDAYTLKKSVYFPQGAYYVTQSLVIKDQVTILGSNYYKGFTNEPSKWECYINSTASKVFVGSTLGTASAYFLTKVLMKNIAIKGSGATATLFDFMQLSKSVITDCMIYNFGYVINGKITNMTDINNNFFINIYTSLLSSRQGTVKSTMTDSKIHHNYINGTAEGNAILIDLEFGNYSDIHHNFIDFAYIGVKLDGSSQTIDISNNLFDVCFVSIHAYSSLILSISNNKFGKCSKSDNTLFTSLSTDRRTELSTTDWIGVKLRYGSSKVSITNSIGYKSDVLINMVESNYDNINTRGNINGYSTGIVVKMARYVDGTKPNDGKNLKIEELNFTEYTTLPSNVAPNIATFDGHIFYYNDKLVRNDSGVFKDMMGTVVS